jgi:serine acetyltransferase
MRIHPHAEVQTIRIGQGTLVWQFAIILEGAVLGENCNVNCHTFIENDVQIGNGVTVKSGVYLWDGIIVEDNVFIGPNATFTNDKYPRSKQHPGEFQKTRLRLNCSIGANATILGGTTVGRYAIVGAGTVVTKDVPDFALVVGNPGRVVGWVDREGNKLTQEAPGIFGSRSGERFQLEATGLKPL